jgi:hypothetical protein
MSEDRFREQGDWRTKRLGQLRALIKNADPGVVEEVKWKKPSNPDGVPVWSHDGIICVGNMLNGRVRLTFFKGAALADPSGLFNAHLDGARRAMELREEDDIDEAAFKRLVRDAVALNTSNTSGE